MKATAILVLGLFAASAAAGTPWEEYLASPTSQNAKRVTAIAYSPSHTPQGGWDSSDLRVLENQVLAQDSAAFQLAVRLYRDADAGLAEDLGMVLSRSVRAHPVFFLREVAVLKLGCSELSWSLTAPGLEYTDRPEAQRYEIRMRRKALSAVRDPSLRRVRDQCVRVLDSPPNPRLQRTALRAAAEPPGR